MFEGFLSFGGNEVVNNERARGYAESADCPFSWFKGPRCSTLRDALGEQTSYTYANIVNAPWYDPSNVAVSKMFYGAYALSVKGMYDSTRQTDIVEGIDDGAVAGASRKAAKEITVRVLLAARGWDALMYGASWLSQALDAQACHVHGDVCGTTDVAFFAECPPEREPDQTPEEYAAAIDPYRLFLHGVTTVSGPTEVERLQDGHGNVAIIMECVLTATRPWVYRATRRVDLPVTPTIVIQDIAYNLAPYPSFELAAEQVAVATNYSTNPSVETNATGWTAVVAALSGTAPASYFTSGRSTDIAAVGSASFRGRILGNGSTTVSGAKARITLYQEVSLAGISVNQVSVSIWGAILTAAGTSATTRDRIAATLEWRTNDGTVLSTIDLGSSTAEDDINGRAFSGVSLQIPAGAQRVRVSIIGDVTWGSSSTPAQNSDVRVYADALAVTVP